MKYLNILFITWILATTAQAKTRIGILDFELNDLTLDPRIPQEIQRTASIKGLLTSELRKAGYQIVDISLNDQFRANAGFGYLFDHDDVAAELGRSMNADYILVGRLHKPSFLFSYLMEHLVRVQDGQLVGNYIVESKGSDSKLILKAVESLADKIDYRLDQQ